MPQHEGIAAADHAGIFQFPGNAACRVSRAQQDKSLRVRRHRHVDVENQPSRDSEQQQKNDGENLAHSA